MANVLGAERAVGPPGEDPADPQAPSISSSASLWSDMARTNRIWHWSRGRRTPVPLPLLRSRSWARSILDQGTNRNTEAVEIILGKRVKKELDRIV